MKHSVDFEWIDEDGDNRYGSEDRDIPLADDFFKDLESVFRKYGLSISHQDTHGAFEIHPFSDENLAWLKAATFTEEAYKKITEKKDKDNK